MADTQYEFIPMAVAVLASLTQDLRVAYPDLRNPPLGDLIRWSEDFPGLLYILSRKYLKLHIPLGRIGGRELI